MSSKHKRQFITTIFTSVGIVAAAALSPLANTVSATSDNGQEDKVAICHATRSNTNPYVSVTLSTSGAYHGLADHSGDIIPPFVFDGETYSQNWDWHEQSIYENNCTVNSGDHD